MKKSVPFLILMTLCVSLTGFAQKKLERPNIIYILADDLGYGDLSCYGQKNFKTPNIDKLAEQGLSFTQHYSGSTVCAPSRYSLLTGKHMGHAFVRGNGNGMMRPDPQDLTVATLLQRSGYHTAMIGKAGTGCKNTPETPNLKGFDYFFGYLGHAQAHSYFPKFLHYNGKQIDFPENGGNKTWRGETYSLDMILDSVLTYIENNKGAPFFLHYASPLPHAQMWIQEKWKEPYKGKFDEKPYKGYYGACDDPNATTAGMIFRLDWEVGQIMKKLEELGIAENTIVMFSSDNGPHVEGGRNAAYHNSSGGFRGVKRDLYEGGIRVPFIVKWPGIVDEGKTTDHISAFWDMVPTFCDIASVSSKPLESDGISMLPLFKGKKQKEHDFLYWEFHQKGGRQAVRMGKWKGVRYNLQEDANAPVRLFNLELDPQEQTDVAKENPKVVKKIMNIFKTERTPSKEFPLYGKK
ncbi:sulfatase [Prolixibacteraceae bacterium JC049]|nr:sulfatase [Prolixibacteraceae bacterium JC049]